MNTFDPGHVNTPGRRARVILVDEPLIVDLATHIARQKVWSARTFGPGERLEGIRDHVMKEFIEIADAEPGTERLGEWIDVLIAALDGCWRSGASPHEIVDALLAKQGRNESRKWPDWRTADPSKAIEHVHGSSPEDEPRSWSEEIRS